MRRPLYQGYFADPFVLALGSDVGYGAIGTGRSEGPSEEGESPEDNRVFELLASIDLRNWTPRGKALNRLPSHLGSDYWAPEIAFEDDHYWLYYSVGHGIAGHHLRVAKADSFFGPYTDLGVNLTAGELFAIDPHPFRDVDGRWYLFFARDVLDAARPGTHLAVAPLDSMTTLASAPLSVLEPNDDWQLYESERAMYGGAYNWHTLEGPSVAKRNGRYVLLYSGGNWTGAGYGVSWAVADHPLGPWSHGSTDGRRLLRSTPKLNGPGHNSLVVDKTGHDVIFFHAWDEELTARRMFANRIDFSRSGPQLGAVIQPPTGPAQVHPSSQELSEA